jgi:hypothetical protein
LLGHFKVILILDTINYCNDHLLIVHRHADS